jgi:hypothetical protein
MIRLMLLLVNYCYSTFSNLVKIILFFKRQNFRKLKSFPIDFLKNYCLLKLKFHRIIKLFLKNPLPLNTS